MQTYQVELFEELLRGIQESVIVVRWIKHKLWELVLAWIEQLVPEQNDPRSD